METRTRLDNKNNTAQVSPISSEQSSFGKKCRFLSSRSHFSGRKGPFVKIHMSSCHDFPCCLSFEHENFVCVVWVLMWCSYVDATIHFWLKFGSLILFPIGKNFAPKCAEIGDIRSFPKVCSWGVHRPGSAVMVCKCAACSNASSQCELGSSPDVASRHLILDTMRSM